MTDWKITKTVIVVADDDEVDPMDIYGAFDVGTVVAISMEQVEPPEYSYPVPVEDPEPPPVLDDPQPEERADHGPELQFGDVVIAHDMPGRVPGIKLNPEDPSLTQMLKGKPLPPQPSPLAEHLVYFIAVGRIWWFTRAELELVEEEMGQ